MGYMAKGEPRGGCKVTRTKDGIKVNCPDQITANNALELIPKYPGYIFGHLFGERDGSGSWSFKMRKVKPHDEEFVMKDINHALDKQKKALTGGRIVSRSKKLEFLE